MTMTPEQVERVRGLLQDAASILSANEQFVVPVVFNDVGGRLADALAALDGDAPGEDDRWSVAPKNHIDPKYAWQVIDKKGQPIFANLRKELADQIAADHNRLPKLERAAREVVKRARVYDRTILPATLVMAVDDLSFALTDEPKP